VRLQTGDAEVEGSGAYEVVVTADALASVTVASGTATIRVKGQHQAVFLAAGETWRAPVITADLDLAPAKAEIVAEIEPPTVATPPTADVTAPIKPTAKVATTVDVTAPIKPPTKVTAVAVAADVTAPINPTTAPVTTTRTATAPTDTTAPIRSTTKVTTPATATAPIKPTTKVTTNIVAPTAATAPAAPAAPAAPTTVAPRPSITAVADPAPPTSSGTSPTENHFRAGYALLRANKHVAAAIELGKAADGDGPLATDARYFQAIALSKAGRSRDAERALVAFLDRAPTSVRRGRASVMLARLLVERGDTKTARAWFESALADSDPSVATAARAGIDALK